MQHIWDINLATFTTNVPMNNRLQTLDITNLDTFTNRAVNADVLTVHGIRGTSFVCIPLSCNACPSIYRSCSFASKRDLCSVNEVNG